MPKTTQSRSERSVTLATLRRLQTVKGLRLFRNNIGVARQPDGSVVRYGVGPNGAGDFIGWESVTITPDMVGRKLARFTSVEFKRTGGRVSENQKTWLRNVNEAGGKAVIIASEHQSSEFFPV